MRSKYLSPHEADEFKALWDDYRSFYFELLARGIPVHVLKAARRGTQPYKKKPFDLNKAIRLYNKGMTASRVGGILGYTQVTVLKRLKEAGVTIHPRGHQSATSRK